MEVQEIGKVKVIKLMERVDSVTCPEVESTLRAAIEAAPGLLICEFGETKYISSSGLRVLLLAAKNLKRAGGQLALVCAKGSYVDEVLELSGITHVLPVFETSDQAMTRLA